MFDVEPPKILKDEGMCTQGCLKQKSASRLVADDQATMKRTTKLPERLMRQYRLLK